MPEILVQGTAEARLEPTGAVLTVTVLTRAADSQEAAVAACAGRAAEVDATVAGNAAVRGAVTSSVRTGPEYDVSGRTRRLVGYTASRTTELECAPDGAGLTALVDALGRMPDVTIAGPDWQVAPDAEGWDAVRGAAAADARRRAQAYALGVDAQIGRVSWLAEPGLRQTGSGGPVGMSFASKRSGMADAGGMADQPRQVRIVPEPVLVTVVVEAAFDLT